MYTIIKYNSGIPTVFRYESKSKKILKNLIHETLYGKVKYKYANELKKSILKIVKINPGILDEMPKVPLKIIREFLSFKIVRNEEQYNAEIQRRLDFAKENDWNDDYDYCKKRVDIDTIKQLDYISLITLGKKTKIIKEKYNWLTSRQQKLFDKSLNVLIKMSKNDFFLTDATFEKESKTEGHFSIDHIKGNILTSIKIPL